MAAQSEDSVLQVHEDIGFQRWSWRGQRLGWAVLAAIVAAALLGLVGPGPLSHSTAVADDGSYAVDYERFARQGGTVEVVIRLDREIAAQPTVEIALDGDLLEAVSVDAVEPRPDSWLIDGGDVRLRFSTTTAARPGSISLRMTPAGMGPAAGTLRVVGHPPVRLWQFVYP